MTRIPLEQKLLKREMDIKYEIQKLRIIIFSYTFRNDIKKIFPYLENKFGCFDSDQLLELAFKNINDYYDIEEFLNYCELILLFVNGFYYKRTIGNY